jgi:hypothetical protein
MRALYDHRDAAVARHEAVPECRGLAVSGEHVDVIALHAHAAILGDETAVVRGAARGITGHAVVLRNVDWRVEWDAIAVDRDGE